MHENAAWMHATVAGDWSGLIERATTAIAAAQLHTARLESSVSRCKTLVRLRARDQQRRLPPAADSLLTSPRIDEARLSVLDDSGAHHVLTPTEWRLLRLLADAQGGVRTRSQLARSLWGFDDGRTSEVEVYISRLRRKLGGDRQSQIITVRGQGYRLARPL